MLPDLSRVSVALAAENRVFFLFVCLLLFFFWLSCLVDMIPMERPIRHWISAMACKRIHSA
jgi:hypothetical protein